MSRDPRYQRLLNDKRWKLLRADVFRRANGLCELCKAEGFITPGVDVHHIHPVETAKTVQEMERLAYNPANLMALCVRHHVEIHQQAGSHTKEAVNERKQKKRIGFLQRNDPNYKEEDNGTGTMEADTDDGRQVRGEQPRTGEDKQSTPRAADADQTEERLPIRDGDTNQRKAEELEGASTGGNAIHPEPIRIDRG